MPTTNGHGPKRAILYARVSTQEQATKGYSLAQQMEALREYASREGYEVLEEVSDPGQSGASLERPGMDRVRDLVAAGGVSVVLAQDRDRIAREPAYHYLLKKEFEEHGTRIRALNDRGDDSPEGELTDGILDQLAKFERAKTTERMRRGKFRKAREGKLIANQAPNYGFSFDEKRTGLVVDEEAMSVVRRVFCMIGVEGRPIYAVRKAFEAEGLPTPAGGRSWSAVYLRKVVGNDVYRAHTFEEVKRLISPEVASGLDPKKRYGIFWWGRQRHTQKQVAETGPDGRRYRKVKKSIHTPAERWIAVPVPDPGIPREWVDAAREAIKDNPRPQRSVWKFWELAGMAHCAGCGRQMGRNPAVNNAGTRFFYYRCSKRAQEGKDACPNNKSFNALKVEPQVWEIVSGLMKNPEQLRADLERMIELEREGRRGGNPERETKAWLDKLAEADHKRGAYQDQQAEGLLTLDELRSKLAALDETREIAERELQALKNHREHIAGLEWDKETLLRHYVALTPEALDALTPEERHDLYRMLKLNATFHPDKSLEVTGAFTDAPSVVSPQTEWVCRP